MWTTSVWIGLVAALAVSGGAASAETAYCPKIALSDGTSVDVIRLVEDGSDQEIITARLRSLNPKGSLWAVFDVTQGNIAALSQLRLSIDERALPPHGPAQPLTAMLRIKDAPPWRQAVPPEGDRFDDFRIDAESHPQLASAFMSAAAADLTITTEDGAAVLSARFPLPAAGDWSELRERIARTMAMVRARTCDVITWPTGPDVKSEAPPELIIDGPPPPTSASTADAGETATTRSPAAPR